MLICEAKRGKKRKKNRLNGGQKKKTKTQESLEKEKYCLEEEARTPADMYSPASVWWRRIWVSPTPCLGGIYRPAPQNPSNDGFGVLMGTQQRSPR